MARIEIFDDWGKLRETIEIVSADAKDLRRIVEYGLEYNDIFKCGVCKKSNDLCNMTLLDDEFTHRCTSCHAAHNPKGESNV